MKRRSHRGSDGYPSYGFCLFQRHLIRRSKNQKRGSGDDRATNKSRPFWRWVETEEKDQTEEEEKRGRKEMPERRERGT